MWKFAIHHLPSVLEWAIDHPNHQHTPLPRCIHGKNLFMPCTLCIDLNIVNTKQSKYRKHLTPGCMHGMSAIWRCPLCESASDADNERFDLECNGPNRTMVNTRKMQMAATEAALDLIALLYL